MEKNKPIYSRPSGKPISIPPETIERKLLLHNEDWMFERKGKQVVVVFSDGEQLEGTIGRIRKFTFGLETSLGSAIVYKVAVKYVREVL
jgi:sRNA-binding regulator protein Hfq